MNSLVLFFSALDVSIVVEKPPRAECPVYSHLYVETLNFHSHKKSFGVLKVEVFVGYNMEGLRKSRKTREKYGKVLKF